MCSDDVVYERFWLSGGAHRLTNNNIPEDHIAKTVVDVIGSASRMMPI